MTRHGTSKKSSNAPRGRVGRPPAGEDSQAIFRTLCKRRYDEAKRGIVHVMKDNGVISCDYPTLAVNRRDNGYSCSVGGKKVNFHRLVYMVTKGNITGEGIEVIHTCQDKYCCKPSHLVKGPKGISIERKGCKGFVKVGDDTFIKACTHEPQCDVITNSADLKVEEVERYGSNSVKEGCLGFLKYDEGLYMVCAHECPCGIITEVTDDMMCNSDFIDVGEDADIDEENDVEREFLSEQDFKEKYIDTDEIDPPRRNMPVAPPVDDKPISARLRQRK